MIYGWLFGILFVILAGVGIIIAVNSENTGTRVSGVIGTIASFILFLCIPFSFHVVDSGEIAVVKKMGRIIDAREAGTHFDFWMTHSYSIYDTKVRQVDITTASYSKDSQPIDIQMVVQYQVDKAEVKTIALTYGGLTSLENRIQSVTIEKTKSIISQYSAENLISQRPELSSKVTEEVGAALVNGYYIHVTNIALTNIDFSDAFEASVEAKMIAEQTKLQKDYENEAAEAAAETAKKVAEMQADAEAYAKEKAAEAEANALILKANADAEALNIQTLEVAKMLGLTVIDDKGTEDTSDDVEVIKPNLTLEEAQLIKDYIEYIKYLETWDGKLPEVVADGSGLIIQP